MSPGMFFIAPVTDPDRLFGGSKFARLAGTRLTEYLLHITWGKEEHCSAYTNDLKTDLKTKYTVEIRGTVCSHSMCLQIDFHTPFR